MSKAAAAPPIELASADESVAREMTRWLSHLGAERRLSPKTLEAYARDLRQCLDFLCTHWGERVTLSRFAALEATDVRAFIPIEPQPLQVVAKLVLVALLTARDVGVFDTQHHDAALLARKQPVEQRGTGVTDVELAGGGRGKADANGGCCAHPMMLARETRGGSA